MESPSNGDLETITLGYDLLAAKWYYTGACALLAYDYALTFSREVEEMWERKKTPMFYLFLINRYTAIAFAVVTLFAYYSPLWTFEVCNRFAIVEWLQTLLIVIPAETVLLYRTYALTGQCKWFFSLLFSVMITQCSVVFYAMSVPGKNNALPIPHYDLEPFHICVLYSDPRMDAIYLALSILFDVMVFTVTIYKTVSDSSALFPRTVLLRTIQRDGAVYFCAILSGNIVWMALSLSARPGLKLINAQPSMIFTSIMINRLTLSLRQASQRGMSFVTSEWGSRYLAHLDEDSGMPIPCFLERGAHHSRLPQSEFDEESSRAPVIRAM